MPVVVQSFQTCGRVARVVTGRAGCWQRLLGGGCCVGRRARLPAAAERLRTLVNSISEGCNSPVARGAGPASDCSCWRERGGRRAASGERATSDRSPRAPHTAAPALSRPPNPLRENQLYSTTISTLIISSIISRLYIDELSVTGTLNTCETMLPSSKQRPEILQHKVADADMQVSHDSLVRQTWIDCCLVNNNLRASLE